MSFIDVNLAKTNALALTSRYINVLVRIERNNLLSVLVPNGQKSADKERLRQIRRTMLKEFYLFISSDQADEFDDRCAALAAVITHLECVTDIDASKVSNEIWSTPKVVIQEAEYILEDLKTLNKNA